MRLPVTRLLALLATLLLFVAAPRIQAAPRPLANTTVVVDPGHGGSDWGVDPAGSHLQEKTVNVQIAERLIRLLEAEGATVVTTRSTDQFVSLNARVRFANALLFRPDNNPARGRLISVHLNSNRAAPTLRRVEVMVDPAASGPFSFAADLAERLRGVTDGSVGYVDAGYPPGVHPADLAPVRWTYPRGQNVLTEPAFLSNPTQARQLREPRFLEALARAHVAALQAEFAELNTAATSQP